MTPITMPAKTLTSRVWACADEAGLDSREVYVRLLTLIWLARPEVVDEAFAKMRTYWPDPQDYASASLAACPCGKPMDHTGFCYE